MNGEISVRPSVNFLLALFFPISVALGGCVPVPIPNPDWVYVPNPADAAALREEGHFCGINTVSNVAGRNIGDVAVKIWFSSSSPGDPDAARNMSKRFTQSEGIGLATKPDSPLSRTEFGPRRPTPASQSIPA
jgi:hypothetical protein